METITKAKSALILDQPFFAAILLGMPIIEDNSVATLATDGSKILYNQEFMSKLTLQETVFVLAHEVLHCVFQHSTRRGDREPKRWNIAADYVINDLLKGEKIGQVVSGALLDSKLVVAGQGTTEGVYGLLPDTKPEDTPGPGESGGSLDDCQDAGLDEASTAEKEAEMRVKIVQAANTAKMAGKMPASLDRIVKTLTKTKVDWKSVLRRFLSERAKIDLSYSKPKRRFLAEDIYLPSATGESLGEIVIAVDCSGSINETLLETFSAEIKAIIEDVKPSVTHVIYFDAEVQHVETFSSDDTFAISAKGGGGTDFNPIFKCIDERFPDTRACVVLTDLYGPCDDNPPSYPVLWASVGSNEAVFGEVLNIKE